LSAQGVALARAVGAELGPIAYVVTSAAPRAIETAIAMGVAVDDTVDLPSGYVPGEVGFHEQWTWAKPWVRYAELLARGGGLATVAEAHRAAWIRAVASVAEGAAALMVSHGGAIEPTLVACLPSADHQHWGPLLGHCDGARLGFADGSLSTSASAEYRPCQHPERPYVPEVPQRYRIVRPPPARLQRPFSPSVVPCVTSVGRRRDRQSWISR
jgi:broad specificity phosphatase PhoE